MNLKKRTTYWIVLALIIIIGLIYWFGTEKKPPPERNFSTSQLLIPSLPGSGADRVKESKAVP